MIRLERSEALKRKIRKDDAVDLAVPDWQLVSEAMNKGKTSEAMDFLEYARWVGQTNNDKLVSFVERLITHIADNYGEEEVFKFLKPRYQASMPEYLSTHKGAVEALQGVTESHRGHHSSFKVTEEPDRYVVTHDPCGSGGRLRRTKKVGVTKKAYPWSWGKVGVPYYCIHCCVSWEITATELRGYPVRITLIGDKPEDPCVHLFYKKPELIPEEYFKRIGMKKDPARFKE